MPKTIRKKDDIVLTPTPQPVKLVVEQPTEPLMEKKPDNRPIIYDKLKILEYSATSELGPLTVDDVKLMMGWETEKEFQERRVKEHPESKPEHWLFGDNGPRNEDTGEFQPVHCLNTNKEKVVCWRNANNRPFDMMWAEDLVHTILRGQWAGPLMMPGETVNGETVRISRYERMLSGQHQCTALILADEYLQKSREKFSKLKDGEAPLSARLEQLGNVPYPAWDGYEHPVIETIVLTGLSEDERILRTIDYVKPRTTADMLYTMPLFRENTPPARKELTRMLSSAIDLLWTRTDTKGYRTHPEIVGFLERHKRLLKCVEHLFKENVALASGGRKISKLRISAGHAASLCYLMGSSGPKTDGDVYRWMSPPDEKGLDWSYMDRALEFWTSLASNRAFIPVRLALGRLVDSNASNDDNQGLGGRTPEKLAIIAKAWDIFKDYPAEAGEPFTDQDMAPGGALCLSYSDLDDKGNKLPDGEIKLLDVADFYGIDCPEIITKSKSASKKGQEPPPPSKEDIERGAEAARQQRKQK